MPGGMESPFPEIRLREAALFFGSNNRIPSKKPPPGPAAGIKRKPDEADMHLDDKTKKIFLYDTGCYEKQAGIKKLFPRNIFYSRAGVCKSHSLRRKGMDAHAGIQGGFS